MSHRRGKRGKRTSRQTFLQPKVGNDFLNSTRQNLRLREDHKVHNNCWLLEPLLSPVHAFSLITTGKEQMHVDSVPQILICSATEVTQYLHWLWTPIDGEFDDYIVNPKSSGYQSFSSVEKLIAKKNAKGAAVQGSGWVWLAVDIELKRLVVETTSNQYKNVRPDYLKNIWKVINWKYASEVYEKECP
ncbi:uncharacterized protein LOC111889816 isoform X2 [Lactuca sativa]|uniref:uncharacterized protein LOC111889816 isoform X2 n=1 Tax=Lactuca sativa TaxID=4236 RepID=UPI0022B051DD|nr:uncharacterized protein LOC111889816 isoform X2 [Lactuca sativa]